MKTRNNSAAKVEKVEELKANTRGAVWKRIVLGALTILALVTVHELTHDHNIDGECLITRAFKNVYVGDEDLSVGVKHQLKEIEENYQKRGVNVEARYINDVLLHGKTTFDELSEEEIKNLKKRGYSVVKRVEVEDGIVSLDPETNECYGVYNSDSSLDYYYSVQYRDTIDDAYAIKFLDENMSVDFDTDEPDIVQTKNGDLVNTNNGVYHYIRYKEEPIVSLELEGDTIGRSLHR